MPLSILIHTLSKCIKLSLTKETMHNLSEGARNNKNKFENINSRVTKLLERAKLSNPRHILKKLLLDMDNLDKFYTDMEYKNKLKSARYLSSEYFELERIYEQEQKVKEKLNLPQNCTIRYEKVKCCKDCRHNTHQYYYAYIWDCDSKKLKKKYIGKQLPLPANIV
jgi:hypothetical protein